MQTYKVDLSEQNEVYENEPQNINEQNIKVKRNIKAAGLFVASLFFVVVTVCVAVIGCNYIVNRNFRETFYNVSSLKVDNKIRIIQISDLHSCSFGKENYKLIDRVKKLKPDVILYTGDCFDSKDKSEEEIVSLCKELAPVAPSYYIYGNNEVERLYDIPLIQEELDKKYGYGDEREPQKLLEEKDLFEETLEKTGVEVLKNECDTITVGSTNIDVFGVLTSNPSSFWTYAGETFNDYAYKNTNNLKITAIHEPFVFEEYEYEFWGDVIVCGHTHGGTVRLPVLGPLYTHEGGLFPERNGDFVYGRYSVSGKPMIVSSGMESNNLLRINNQPELVIIDVNRF
ncbi:MAG: metallophosphoesterase [Clostridia bacterium]|nr:metallophosphoesterase [Clostridia bacterium]